MLWLFFIGLVLAFFVLRALANSRNAELEAGATYESVKRSDPESELAKLSESEFKLAYLKAHKARSKAVPGIGFFAFIITFAISLLVVDDNQDGETLVYVLMVSLLLAVIAGVISHYKLPKISSIMKNQLKQAASNPKF